MIANSTANWSPSIVEWVNLKIEGLAAEVIRRLKGFEEEGNSCERSGDSLMHWWSSSSWAHGLKPTSKWTYSWSASSAGSMLSVFTMNRIRKTKRNYGYETFIELEFVSWSLRSCRCQTCHTWKQMNRNGLHSLYYPSCHVFILHT